VFGGTRWGGSPSGPHGVPIIPIWGGEFWGGLLGRRAIRPWLIFGVALFGVASFSGVARDKALAKVGSHPDYLFLCGFWLKKKKVP